jgi:hypothetical protein
MLKALSVPVAMQRRRFSTIEPPAIVSRRAWLAYRKRHPSPIVKKTAAPKEEEKPWPRNIVLSAYAFAGVFIPYSFAWYLSMDERLRRVVTSVFPGSEDILRSHFGHDEYTSYQDLKEGVEPKKKLDDEDPFVIRKQQELIDQLNKEETPVQIYVIRGGDIVSMRATFNGDLLATSQNLMPAGHDGRVAIDFDDLPSEEPTLVDDLATGFSQSSTSLANHVYSYWFYQPPSDPQELRKVQQSSLHDIEVSRLEYTIKKLEEELNDINSTRDIDEMRQELAQCKKELRNMRWKKRLGL